MAQKQCLAHPTTEQFSRFCKHFNLQPVYSLDVIYYLIWRYIQPILQKRGYVITTTCFEQNWYQVEIESVVTPEHEVCAGDDYVLCHFWCIYKILNLH
jgi:hypothetical protein